MTSCEKSKFTRRQWLTLFAIGSVHFSLSVCVSLQAPFYPQEAESKNATATESGFVFGIFELMSFVSSPILGHYMDVIGAKTLLSSGIIIAAISTIAFGLLDLINTRVSFIALSFLVRAIEALGSSAAVTSAFAMTAMFFPDNVATTFATLEIFYGVGYIVGPTIGGVLFSLGGFIIPFVVVGVVLLLDGIFLYFALPVVEKGTPKPKAKVTEILKVPVVLIDSFGNMGTAICMGFYAATLEPHIREFNLSPITVGLMFVISGGVYASFAPVIGRLCDKKANPKYLMLVGNLTIILSVFLVGPAPFTPLTKSLGLVIAGLVLEGLGMAFLFVSGFVDAIRSAIAGGFPDEISTYGLISGLYAASFSLGDFIGPSVGGALKDLVGFETGSLFIVAVHILTFLIMVGYLLRLRQKKSRIGTMDFNLPSIQNNTEKDQPISIICETKQIKRSSDGYGTMINGK